MGKYELNPIGVPEVEYEAKRQALLEQLSNDPQRAAIFMLVEALWRLEQGDGVPEGETHEMRWNRGDKSSEYIQAALGGLPGILPVPKQEFAKLITFNWYVNSDRASRDGFRNMRILNEGTFLTLKANLGKLGPIRELVSGLVDDIPYPVHVWDDFSFFYDNPALQAAKS